MQNCNHHSKVKKKKKKKWGKFGWVFFSIFSRKNGSNDTAAATDHQLKRVESNWIRNESSSAIPPDSPFKSYSFLKLLQMEDEQQKKANNLKPTTVDKTLKMLSFSRLLLKKLIIKTKSSNEIENTNSNSSNNNVSRIAEIVIRRQPSQRLKMAQSLTKMTSRRASASQDECDQFLTTVERGGKSYRGGEELCKKRILMGEKCKPLRGGILQYDRDGVLKPDIVP